MKIDTSLIAGYDEMSTEQKLEALQDYEFEDSSAEITNLNAEITKLKNQVSKANTEAKKWKDAHNNQLTEEERSRNEINDQLELYKTRIAELEKKEAISDLKAKFLGQGFEEDLAVKAAEAYYNKDNEEFFRLHLQFMDKHDKSKAAELLKNTPNPKSGGGDDTPPITLEQFRKLPPVERKKFYDEHPEEYKRLYEKE